jgi:hypothetical protein
MPSGKYLLLFLTPIVYIWHYGISWFFYKSNWKSILEDIHKLGIELSFVGITLFVGALFDKTSLFRTLLVNSEIDAVIASVVVSILESVS